MTNTNVKVLRVVISGLSEEIICEALGELTEKLLKLKAEETAKGVRVAYTVQNRLSTADPEIATIVAINNQWLDEEFFLIPCLTN